MENVQSLPVRFKFILVLASLKRQEKKKENKLHKLKDHFKGVKTCSRIKESKEKIGLQEKNRKSEVIFAVCRLP